MRIPLITNLIARLVSKRVRELELEVKSLQDLVADGITNVYSSFEVWRCFAMIYLHDHGVLETLLRERM